MIPINILLNLRLTGAGRICQSSTRFNFNKKKFFDRESQKNRDKSKCPTVYGSCLAKHFGICNKPNFFTCAACSDNSKKTTTVPKILIKSICAYERATATKRSTAIKKRKINIRPLDLIINLATKVLTLRTKVAKKSCLLFYLQNSAEVQHTQCL